MYNVIFTITFIYYKKLIYYLFFLIFVHFDFVVITYISKYFQVSNVSTVRILFLVLVAKLAMDRFGLQ